MESVGSAPRDHLDLAAAVAPELRGVGLGLHLKFTRGFGSYAVVTQGYAGVVIIDTVQQEVIVAGALSVDTDPGGAGAARCGRRQECQLVHVARTGGGGHVREEG